jgi:hypothetical protein
MNSCIKALTICWSWDTQYYLQHDAFLYVSEAMNSVLYAEDKMDTETEVPCHILVFYDDPDLIYGYRSCSK